MTCYTCHRTRRDVRRIFGWPSRDTTNSPRDANPSSLSLFTVAAEAHTRKSSDRDRLPSRGALCRMERRPWKVRSERPNRTSSACPNLHMQNFRVLVSHPNFQGENAQRRPVASVVPDTPSNLTPTRKQDCISQSLLIKPSGTQETVFQSDSVRALHAQRPPPKQAGHE